MKIVADENIPLVDYYFGSCGQLILKPGRAITHDDLLDADILLVRSVTLVNRDLLHGTSVKFVGSTTTGADHMDTHWLNQADIHWSVATGCNRIAVVEYVISVIAALQKMNLLQQKNSRAGVIGVGAIGQQVAEKLKILGFDVLLCDPFRSMQEKNFTGVRLEDFTDLDFITLHTPLTYEGAYPTYHLIDKDFMQRQKKNCVLLNTGRGNVIHFTDLKEYGEELIWCLDVWENEPNIDLDVLQKALIATPHIAGYSVQSKYRGIEMIYQAALKHGVIAGQGVLPIIYPQYELPLIESLCDWRDVVLAIYNPLITTKHMQQELLKNKHGFDGLRKHFPDRHEFNFVNKEVVLDDRSQACLTKLFRSS
jgi:erythronate-4-phosphate dehydrogenase